MPETRFRGPPLAVGLALVLACQVQDQGLVTAVPSMDGSAAQGVDGRPAPSIDPPAAPTAPEPDAATPLPDVGPPVAIDPLPVAQDAGPEAARPAPDAAAAIATNCAMLRSGPFTARLRSPNVESDELTFDRQGRLLLFRGNDVVRMADGNTEVVLRDVLGNGGGALRFLPDGSLIVADFSGDRLTMYDPPSRSALFVVATQSPMKVAVGPAGRLYVSSNSGLIYLLNPATSRRGVVGDPDDGVGGLAFSPDHRTLYAGLLDEEAIAAFPVRPDGQLGPRSIVARQIPYPLGLTVDECGNIYTSGGSDGRVRRVSPGGRIDLLVQVGRAQLWGLGFGSGQHGWSQTALYVSSASNGQSGLFEIEMGVRGAPQVPAPSVP